MSRAGHTPGPWYAVGMQVEHPDDSKADICTCDPANMGQDKINCRPTYELYANARLIAAAPDLLSACAAWVEYMDSPLTAEHSIAYENRLIEALRNAVARTGGWL